MQKRADRLLDSLINTPSTTGKNISKPRRENIARQHEIYARRIKENKKTYSAAYREFFDKGGAAWYESVTGAKLDIEKIYLDIQYFTEAIQEACGIEEDLKFFVKWRKYERGAITEEEIEKEQQEAEIQRGYRSVNIRKLEKKYESKAREFKRRLHSRRYRLRCGYEPGEHTIEQRTCFMRGRKIKEINRLYANGEHKNNPRYRQLLLFLATPGWADLDVIKGFYVHRDKLNLKWGIPHTVDHIVPIRHDKVCGLHAPDNLQIITEVQNIKKSNKFKIGA